MFRTYEHGCARYKPTLRLSCAIISLVLCLCEFGLALSEYIHSREGNILAAIFTGMFAFHGCVTLLYFVGIIRQNECFLLPFLTGQLIFITTLGLLVIIWWIATLLAVFDLVHYKSPIGSLSNSEFFILAGIGLVFLFVVSSKISHLLYKGYKRVEKENIYRRRIGTSVKSISRSNTIPPSNV